jgi:hypothetical protein
MIRLVFYTVSLTLSTWSSLRQRSEIKGPHVECFLNRFNKRRGRVRVNGTVIEFAMICPVPPLTRTWYSEPGYPKRLLRERWEPWPRTSPFRQIIVNPEPRPYVLSTPFPSNLGMSGNDLENMEATRRRRETETKDRVRPHNFIPSGQVQLRTLRLGLTPLLIPQHSAVASIE